MPSLNRETVRAGARGVVATLLVAALIAIGSRNLAHFDAALVGYTFATLFAVFGITYRYSMWLQRPPTALYWRRGWQVFFSRDRLLSNLAAWPKRVVSVFAFNNFIFRRSRTRWAAHWLIMWGCLLAGAITFPLVFGWIHFQTPADDFERYRVYVFGFPTFSFRIGSVLGGLIFHGLVWASFLVIAGVMIAMRRRMRDRGAEAVQQFGEDFLPLILLFAVSITGLMLTASYTWMKGYAYDFLAIVHAACVIFTLLWLPFGKFFHIFQRPAQLGVSFYKDAGRTGEQALCRNCAQPFASKAHVEDLIRVERELGYDHAPLQVRGHQACIHDDADQGRRHDQAAHHVRMTVGARVNRRMAFHGLRSGRRSATCAALGAVATARRPVGQRRELSGDKSAREEEGPADL